MKADKVCLSLSLSLAHTLGKFYAHLSDHKNGLGPAQSLRPAC